jgi:hypothetical protein
MPETSLASSPHKRSGPNFDDFGVRQLFRPRLPGMVTQMDNMQFFLSAKPLLPRAKPRPLGIGAHCHGRSEDDTALASTIAAFGRADVRFAAPHGDTIGVPTGIPAKHQPNFAPGAGIVAFLHHAPQRDGVPVGACRRQTFLWQTFLWQTFLCQTFLCQTFLCQTFLCQAFLCKRPVA